jgi:regulator of PEP synthase PpsR (kinase-PPPase family)
MTKRPFILYAVSDATGDLSVNIAVAAVEQFQALDSEIRRHPVTDTPDKVHEVVQEAKKEEALILYTLVSEELRHLLMEEAHAHGVAAIDVMGPVLEKIAEKAKLKPSDQPGLQYKKPGHHRKRTEMMTFTVKHDDGQGMDSIGEADIIIVGISRTSKTPLAMYLAHRGFKVANVPIVKGVEVPQELFEADQRKLVGLTIDQEKLSHIRSSRLQKLGRSLNEDYASSDYIKEELDYQRQIFADLGNIPVVNVTRKAIEEVATEILTILGH